MKYRKKPVVVEAFELGKDEIPKWFEETSTRYGGKSRKWQIYLHRGSCVVEIGDMIIKGVQGEIYPCKKDIFDATYEKVDD